ncbi:hypothetical protein M2189_002370 [Bradyrhizobium japonicum]|uniref:hypothetical protein n=1 Tax=Bradyrhizobium japonicum TaxID=375 RepID=UPI002167E013|nr:hypothetical protein [Bradyrhizobium japonicum]MCS3498671.1 hypothetical protein [Bradyrhizobium japonicum]MCS3959167.1 hypothetical protein [Bradyrhizobium japonicum]MCS4000922.1 hypothetical protein [Bradyrhizobium japonicum]
MRRLADLAHVRESSLSDFSQNVCNIIIDAHLNVASMRGSSAPKVKEALSSVAKQAAKLAATLRKMDLKIAGGTGGSDQTAGTHLEWELAKLKEPLFPKYPELLDLLHAAATSARTLSVPKRGPKGAGGNQAFDVFIEQLNIAAYVRDGRWSVHRATDGTWKGSILEALQLLKPYLPARFFPPGELGRSVDHILGKLRKRKTP